MSRRRRLLNKLVTERIAALILSHFPLLSVSHLSRIHQTPFFRNVVPRFCHPNLFVTFPKIIHNADFEVHLRSFSVTASSLKFATLPELIIGGGYLKVFLTGFEGQNTCSLTTTYICHRKTIHNIAFTRLSPHLGVHKEVSVTPQNMKIWEIHLWRLPASPWLNTLFCIRSKTSVASGRQSSRSSTPDPWDFAQI